MKFQNSAIAATSLSGKSGGTVATKNNIFRRKSNPRQPRSPAQGSARARFVSMSTGWGALTEAQQNSFIAAAPNFVFFDNGESYTLKGNTLYQQINNNLAIIGEEPITEAPLPAALPNLFITSVDAYYDEEGFHANVNTNEYPAVEGFAPVGIVTNGFPPGKRSVKNRLRNVGEQATGVNYIDLGGVFMFQEGFYVPAVGSRLELGFYLISRSTGQASQIQTAQTIVIDIT